MSAKGRETGKVARIVLLAVVAGLAVGLMASAAHAGISDRDAMKRATNTSRLNHDIRMVGLNAEMSELARRHSLKMARQNRLFHTADPSSYYLKGMNWRYWGENVGVTGGTVKDLQAAFMASPGHRANILNKAFTKVAIGAVRRDGALWVTVFFYG
jgi:uncharacterized protein YkwD